ncbi:hypothetical protein IM796_03300 [Streptomyces albidoflavus]|nr:hypothetical protein [Streptomyces albidoflavus]
MSRASATASPARSSASTTWIFSNAAALLLTTDHIQQNSRGAAQAAEVIDTGLPTRGG